MNCPECNGTNIIDGFITGHYGVFFTEKGTENKFRPNSYKVQGKACVDCGKIFDMRLVPKKTKVKKNRYQK